MSLRQSSELDPINDFRNELKRCTMKTPDPPLACGRSYVRVAKLKQWFKSSARSSQGDKTTQATRLLEFLYHKFRNVPHARHMTKDKLFGDYPCIIVFSILLKIDHGDLIYLFRTLLNDTILPVRNIESLKVDFREVVKKAKQYESDAAIIEVSDKIATEFFNEQWQFCPVKLGSYDFEFLGFENHWIIPIHKKEIISDKGGTAKLWQIEVLKEFVNEKLQQAVPTSEYTPVDDPDQLGARYHFALKTFNEGNADICNNEIEAFDTLREHNGMVRYLGGYCHDEAQFCCNGQSVVYEQVKTKPIYNILLEYGDQDLDEYERTIHTISRCHLIGAEQCIFCFSLPPVQQTEIECFWKHLFSVSDAIERIHNWVIKNDGIKREYIGWHADIKPENILEIEGEFKLADPGFATFLERDKGKSNADDPKARMPGGTFSFGAPELYPGSGGAGEANRTIDVWSLGCVFSVAATWVALGYQGIKQYGALRTQAIDRRIEDGCIGLPFLDHGDYFHDGMNVLPEVIGWHKYLRSILRKTDRVTSLVLDIINEDMLVGSPESRIDSSKLCNKLKAMWQNLDKSEISGPEPILEFLRDLDAKISDNANKPSEEIITQKLPSHSTFKDRRDRKSKYLETTPLIPTTHRSRRKSMLVPPPTNTNEKSHQPSTSAIEEDTPVQLPTIDISESSPIRPKSEPEDQRLDSIMSYPPQQPKWVPNSFSDPITENIFQARDALNNKNQKWGMFSMFKSRSRKDEILAKYYQDRDIKFLVDNAESMLEYWFELIVVLETLLKKVQGLDDDGIDVTFTQGPVEISVKNMKDIAKIKKKMMLDPAILPTRSVATDMIGPLQDLFEDRIVMAKAKIRAQQKLKKMTIIILTDGIWSNTPDKDGVGRAIVSFVQELKKITSRDPTDRPISIQFIQFGSDVDASARLEKLDNNLEGIPDVVDTEHCEGNVYKMLLGSFVPIFDELDGYNNLSPTSSSARKKPAALSQQGSDSRQSIFTSNSSTRYSSNGSAK